MKHNQSDDFPDWFVPFPRSIWVDVMATSRHETWNRRLFCVISVDYSRFRNCFWYRRPQVRMFTCPQKYRPGDVKTTEPVRQNSTLSPWPHSLTNDELVSEVACRCWPRSAIVTPETGSWQDFLYFTGKPTPTVNENTTENKLWQKSVVSSSAVKPYLTTSCSE